MPKYEPSQPIRYVVSKPNESHDVTGEPLGPSTYADYARTPEGERYELIQGFLVRDPSPLYNHQALSVELTVVAALWARKDGTAIVFHAPYDVVFDEYNVLQPDLLVFRDGKRDKLTRRGLETAPDLVCEILSPSTRHRDTGVKLGLYSQFGVRECWIVDPIERSIYKYVRDEEEAGFELQGEYRSGKLPSAAFPTLSIDVGELFTVLDRFR